MSSLATALDDAHRLLGEFRSNPKTLEAMQATVDLLVHAFRNGGKAMSAGNGGSMTDAMHFAEEFSGRFRYDRPPLPAIALSDPAHMSCVAAVSNGSRNRQGDGAALAALTWRYCQLAASSISSSAPLTANPKPKR